SSLISPAALLRRTLPSSRALPTFLAGSWTWIAGRRQHSGNSPFCRRSFSNSPPRGCSCSTRGAHSSSPTLLGPNGRGFLSNNCSGKRRLLLSGSTIAGGQCSPAEPLLAARLLGAAVQPEPAKVRVIGPTPFLSAARTTRSSGAA